MSYEKVTNISIKKHTIRQAANNIRPLDYYVNQLPTREEGLSDEEFIKHILINTYEGGYHIQGSSCWKFVAAELKVRKLETEEYKKIVDIYDKYLDDTYTLKERKEARERLTQLLYDVYLDVEENKTPGDYIILYGNQNTNFSLVRKTPCGTSIAFSREDNRVRHFTCYEEAEAYLGHRRDDDTYTILNTEYNLPDRVCIKFKDLGCTIDTPEIDEIIGEYLSDTYGYCHFGFNFEPLMQNKDYVVISNIQWDTSE